ncbi:MAG: nicotinate phosphoribosyltransferase [Deltaproteobacteria bacterium]|nr:nicotinate phosphoribosyltransferase [Deltaproteobacteria bacterium]
MALLTDLYELTMAQSYLRGERNEMATFDLFVRHLPLNRSFLVSAGLKQILLFLERMSFTDDTIHYLKKLNMFSNDFLDYLRKFKFTGTVYAIPEGEIYFPNEPTVVVTAPRIEAQIVETFLLNTFNFESLIASKAARVVIAAEGRAVVDFSPRRDHGADAAMKAARASYIAGCAGTSNVLAGKEFGIPVYGTMAHSYVMSFKTEIESFREFVKDFPDNSVLLIDTYDVIEGSKNAILVGKEMEKEGKKLKGVRIDSGDLAELSQKVRRMLDDAGLDYAMIMASGDLNEYRIKELIRRGLKADVFGVGTEMGTSKDAPALGGIYKLVEDNFGPRMKFSEDKVTLPGKKSLFRILRTDGKFEKDLITLHGEKPDSKDAYPLLVKAMENGKIISDLLPLSNIRERFRESLERLPDELKEIDEVHEYRVEISPLLKSLMREIRSKMT